MYTMYKRTGLIPKPLSYGKLSSTIHLNTHTNWRRFEQLVSVHLFADSKCTSW